VPEYGTPRLAVVGNPLRSIDISDALVATFFVLLPPEPVPPLVSLVAPVVAVTVTEPDAVGVPETAHEMLDPIATAVGGVGVHTPSVTPAGNPLTEQDAAIAPAVAPALFVHKTVPE
jgi:hypothetical protein